MILADTSVWIDHFNRGDETLAELLNETSVICHPHVIGELACGHLKKRNEILSLLHSLPRALVASDREALAFIENNQLTGKGVGYIDIHLLSATALTTGAWLWTRDIRLAELAKYLGLGFEMS